MIKVIEKIWLKILIEYWNFTIPLLLKLKGVELGHGVTFYGMPIVHKCLNSRIIIRDNVVLCSDSRFTALGINHPVVLRTIENESCIIIGNNTGMSGGSICAAKLVEIGDEYLLGANVIIADTDFHAINPSRRRFNKSSSSILSSSISIENNVFIGVDSIVLKGVKVGENSIIGAKSVITSDVPSNTIFAGNPSHKIRNI